MLKRLTVIAVALVMVFSSYFYVNAADLNGKTLRENVEKQDNQGTKKLKENANPDKKVRVIVELETEAPIEKATKNG